jgi:hypothetical protein
MLDLREEGPYAVSCHGAKLLRTEQKVGGR